jgi:hypothetical protein
MQTIGYNVSMLRREIKAMSVDVQLTDRYLYNLLMKHADWLIKREDDKWRVLNQEDVLQPWEVGMEEVLLVAGFKKTVYRSTATIPPLFEGTNGLLIRGVTTLDGSEEIVLVSRSRYENIQKQSSRKYNKTRYAWIEKGYLYTLDSELEGLRVEGLFKQTVSSNGCEDVQCIPAQKQGFYVPEFLMAEMFSHAVQDLRNMFGIPTDTQMDLKNVAQ